MNSLRPLLLCVFAHFPARGCAKTQRAQRNTMEKELIWQRPQNLNLVFGRDGGQLLHVRMRWGGRKKMVRYLSMLRSHSVNRSVAQADPHGALEIRGDYGGFTF